MSSFRVKPLASDVYSLSGLTNGYQSLLYETFSDLQTKMSVGRSVLQKQFTYRVDRVETVQRLTNLSGLTYDYQSISTALRVKKKGDVQVVTFFGICACLFGALVFCTIFSSGFDLGLGESASFVFQKADKD